MATDGSGGVGDGGGDAGAAAAAGPGADIAANGGGAGGAADGADGDEGFKFSPTARKFIQFLLIALIVLNTGNAKQKKQQRAEGEGRQLPRGAMRNLFGVAQECDLYVHYHPLGTEAYLPLAAVRNETLSAELGYELVWHTSVLYKEKEPAFTVNITVPPLPDEVLDGGAVMPRLYATLVRSDQLADAESGDLPAAQVVSQSAPLIQTLRDLNVESSAENLLMGGGDGGGGSAANGQAAAPRPAKAANASKKLPYWKTKMEIRPVVDASIYSVPNMRNGPLRKLRAFPDQGFYQPYLYLSDFWLLEKDYLEINRTLAGQRLNLSLTYTVTSLWVWSLQLQMADQWAAKSEWELTDPQRDAFMLKRLITDTNPYFLAFSALFVMLHSVFSLLAFKNDIQFWRKNESMQGLSARSMCISFVCQLITGLYLLDSQEAARLIVFQIFLDILLAFWKLQKAVKISLVPHFPFVSFDGQKGYDESGTSQYDKEAIRYVSYVVVPLWICYVIRSLFVDKYRSWWSFIIGNAAGGVYAFGFINMTPQLYINYKLKSVEHLPWRALSYRAMNTFIDDVFAFLIDMPTMHRVSCFRDDIIFAIYCFQRWYYRVDMKRQSMWVSEEERASAEGAPPAAVGDEAASDEAVGGGDSAEWAEAVPESAAGAGAAAEEEDGDGAGLRQRR